MVVNKKTNVERKFIKDIRFWLMCWKKFGADLTQLKFLIQFPEKKGFLRYDGATPQFYNYLNGKILFLGMVRGGTDEMYLKFKTVYDILYTDMQKQKPKEIEFVRTKFFVQPSFNLKKVLDVWENEGFANAMDGLDI